MAEYDLGTAKGKLVLDSSGVDKGVDSAGRSIDSLDEKSRRGAGGLQVLEKSMVAVGIAGVAAFAFAINKAADFEASLSGIKAVSGATADQMELLRKKALKLGADTVFSAGDASLAMEELAKSGLKVDDILNGAADATVALAAAGQIDLPQAATIAANAMNQFGLSAAELPHVADLIAGAANASSIDVSDFGLSLAQAGAVANLTGLSFDDLALAVTAMGNAGIKGSDAGTSLKTFLTGLQPVTDKQRTLFFDLGLAIEGNATAMNTMGNSFFDGEGKVKSMSEISGTLATALAGMSEQQKIATLETLFGSDAIRAAAIIAETGAAGFDTLAASMGEVTAADVAATRLDNFKGSLEQLKGSLETAAITVGTMFLPALRDLADFGTTLINKFSDMDEGTQKMIVGFSAGGVAAAGLLGSIGLFAHASAPAISGIGGMVSGVGSLGASLIGALGPVGLIVAAVVALIAILVAAYFKFQAVRDIVDTVGRTIRDFAMNVADWFNKNVLPALKKFADFFMEEIVPALASFTQTVGTIIETVVGFFTDTLVPGIQTAFNWVQDIIMAFWGWFDENVLSTATAFIELLIAIFDKVVWYVENILIPQMRILWAFLAPIIEAVFGTVAKIIGVAFDIIIGIFNVFIGFVTKAWSLFGDNILAAIMLVFNTIKLFIETILGVVRGIIQVITGLITGDWDKAWEGIKTIVTTVWDAIKTYIEIAINAVKLVIETVVDAIQLILSTAWDTILLTATTIWELIKLAITAPLGLIAGVLQGIWDGITTAADIAWNAIKTAAGVVWSAITLAITQPIHIVRDTLQTIWDTIKGAASTAWNAVKDVIKPIIDKIVATIQTIIDKVKEAIDWMGKVKDFIVSPAGTLLDSATIARLKAGTGGGGDVLHSANGRLVTHKVLSWLGEKGPEVVIPLNDPSRAAYLAATSGLTSMLADTWAPASSAPSSMPFSPPPSSGPSSIEGVHIESANFYDAVDIDTLMSQADFAIQGAKL